jgi:hypothetical protein
MHQILFVLLFRSFDCDEFKPEEIELYNRWLYTPRTDGKPRVLILRHDLLCSATSNVLHFIDGIIKQVQFFPFPFFCQNEKNLSSRLFLMPDLYKKIKK